MTQAEVLDILRKTGVLLEGHFRLTSGKHADFYMQFAQLMQYPEEAGPLCDALAGMFKEEGVQVVVGPATGAIIMAYEIARSLGAKAMFGERDNGVMSLRRGFTIHPGEKVLVVEDVVTTGGSVREVMEAVEKAGGKVIGAAVFVDRSGGRVDLGVPIKSLVTMDTKVYQPEECPLCAQGIPAIKPGSRQV
ncbi:orotate phosphoribosyltransferase [Candidatus Formimonas warabiya]|uniref:Orotate phosphoribosyltransferase n=1 Tax=Formimonas warabiya TaxID=1761012 RepID=A0A3G1KXS4_FORW1|nr:orotate phosphoribosyltransferase [Candidatus Formimonas warabiya]ATW27169.1 orotate phosphoribosyltransferase [Candidatus Formimonas warabiya]